MRDFLIHLLPALSLFQSQGNLFAHYSFLSISMVNDSFLQISINSFKFQLGQTPKRLQRSTKPSLDMRKKKNRADQKIKNKTYQLTKQANNPNPSK